MTYLIMIDEISNNIRHNNDNKAKNNAWFTSKLTIWAIKENITLSVLGNLLSILREIPGCNDIPKDSRTLVKTSRKIIVSPLDCGEYVYFGIEKTINLFCKNHKISIQQNEEFLLAVNIGLLLSKSSNSSFWPILCSVKSIKILMQEVFLVALHQGWEKPKSANDFLKDFVNEFI